MLVHRIFDPYDRLYLGHILSFMARRALRTQNCLMILKSRPDLRWHSVGLCPDCCERAKSAGHPTFCTALTQGYRSCFIFSNRSLLFSPILSLCK